MFMFADKKRSRDSTKSNILGWHLFNFFLIAEAVSSFVVVAVSPNGPLCFLMASCDKLDKWALRQQHDLLDYFFLATCAQSHPSQWEWLLPSRHSQLVSAASLPDRWINLVVSRFIRAFYITVDYSNSAGWLVGVLNTFLVCGQARDSKSKYVKFWLACSWCSGLAKFLPEWCVLFIFQISPAQPSSLWPAHVARSFRYLIDPTRQQTTWN